jgi:hypothetical protein
MIRWATAGVIALAAATGAMPASAAKGGTAKYVATWPNPGVPTTWDVSITSSGAVTGSYKVTSTVVYTPQTGSGGSFRVHYAFAGTMTGTLSDGVLQIAGTTKQEARSSNESYNYAYTFDFSRSATVVPDAEGNLMGASDTGESFTWWAR